MTAIVSLRNTTKDSLDLVGEKAVNLGILSQKFPTVPAVPVGFVITARGFQSFLAQIGIEKEVDIIKNIVENDNFEKLSQMADALQHLITDTSLPGDFADELLDAYYSLNIDERQSLNELMNQGEEPFVAVRPSPIGYAGAGLHKSFMNVRGMQELEKALLECWASFYSIEALDWRRQQPQEILQKIGFAVIIQKMIDSHAAGILETSYKMNNEEVFILGCKGLGTALSTGVIVPDKYFITKKTLNIALVETSKQQFFFERDLDTNKTTKVYLQEEYNKKQKISDRHIGELTLIAKKIEEVFGKPQTVDFAVWKENIYLLGCSDSDGWKEQQEKHKEKFKVSSIQESTQEELQQKEQEISVGLIKELENDTFVESALNGDKEIKNIDSTNLTYFPDAIPTHQPLTPNTQDSPYHNLPNIHTSDTNNFPHNIPNDINSIIQSITFDSMLQEVEQHRIEQLDKQKEIIQEKAQQTPQQTPPVSFIFTEQKKTAAITEEVTSSQINIKNEIKYEEGIEAAEVSKMELTPFEKASGAVIIHCFKELKEKIPKEEWGNSPVLQHLAVLAQNFSQKNVPPTSAQIKFALDALEAVK